MSADPAGLDETRLIHDWNAAGGASRPARGTVRLNDETLRDGLQSPSARTPAIEDRIALLHHMARLGIEAAALGLPGAGPHVVESTERLAREIADAGLPIAPNCAARTLRQDIRPILEISERVGLAIEVACFVGSSPIRQYAEGWDLERLLRLTEEAVAYGVSTGLPVMYVTEDSTRARPEDLRRLYTAAVEAGARRVCVTDTVGHATPEGARNLVRFMREVVDATGEEVAVDWHGHRDRGLSIVNALAAAEAGADRLHATALGIGERSGNTPMDLLLVNLVLLGWVEPRDLSALAGYCALASESIGIPFPDNYPVVGKDAFRTATGVHAAAIIKARAKGDDWLADRIYSGVPASVVGRRQRIEIGPMSGKSNVAHWLAERGVEPADDLVEEIFQAAKASPTVLRDDEVSAICRRHGAAPVAAGAPGSKAS